MKLKGGVKVVDDIKPIAIDIPNVIKIGSHSISISFGAMDERERLYVIKKGKIKINKDLTHDEQVVAFFDSISCVCTEIYGGNFGEGFSQVISDLGIDLIFSK